jgi:hypothetical protein
MRSIQEGKRLTTVLAQMPEVRKHLNAVILSHLESPEEYLGVAEKFRTAQLSRKSAKQIKKIKNKER